MVNKASVLILLIATLFLLQFAPLRGSTPAQDANTQVTYTITLKGVDKTALSIDGGAATDLSKTKTVTLDGSKPHQFQVQQMICQSGWECGNQVTDWKNGKRLVANQWTWSVAAGTIETRTYTETYYDYEFVCTSYDSHGSCVSGYYVTIPYTQVYTQKTFTPPCKPCQFTFEYTPQYRLVIEDKHSAAGTRTSGWYDSCTQVQLPGLDHPDTIDGAPGVRDVFNAWAVDGSVSTGNQITMCAPHKATATYVTQYRLDLTSQCPEALRPVGAGWYNDGATATIRIENAAPMQGFFGMLGGRFVFLAWVGTVGVMGTPTAQVDMTQPQNYVATCRADWTWPLVDIFVPGIGIIILLGGVIIGIIPWPPWRGGRPPRGGRNRWPPPWWPPWNPGGGPGGPGLPPPPGLPPTPGGPGIPPGPGGPGIGPGVQPIQPGTPPVIGGPGQQPFLSIKPGVGQPGVRIGPGLQPKIGPGQGLNTPSTPPAKGFPLPIMPKPSRFCKHCGEKLRSNSKYCRRCGLELH